MLAASLLHRAGIMHGKLLDDMHFVPGTGGGMRIVGFSAAITHECEESVPTLYNKAGMFVERHVGCRELDQLEDKYGILGSPQSPRTTQQHTWEV